MKTGWPIVVMLFGLTVAAGCGSKKGDVEQAVRFAKRIFEQVNTREAAALAFRANIEGGGTPFIYLTASLPPNCDLPPFFEDEPGGPWCTVIRYDVETGSVIIEGYGEDPETPFLREEVALEMIQLE